jgi:hypothetical protein
MKKITSKASRLVAPSVLLTTILAAGTVGVVPAYATFNLCGTSLCTDNSDFYQHLLGMQKAINNIVNFDDANDLVQEAVNAGNLVNVGDVDDAMSLANVSQFADLYQFASNNIDGGNLGILFTTDIDNATQSATNVVNSISGDLVTAVVQKSFGQQDALNNITGDYQSTFTNLEQAATNVVNTLTAGTSRTIEQTSQTAQSASNTISGGWGGYDTDVGASVDWAATGDDAATRTQAAVNAANLVNIEHLTMAITQDAHYNPQTATNSASFYGNIYDLGQSATNVLNNVTVETIDPSFFCNCYGGWEVNQDAYAAQVSTNLISTMGDVNNAIQSATNVANSISVPSNDD